MRSIIRETGLKILRTDEGFRVTEVRPGSSADRSGVQAGDVIVGVQYAPATGFWGRFQQGHFRGECLVHIRDARTGDVVARWVDFGDPGVFSDTADAAASLP